MGVVNPRYLTPDMQPVLAEAERRRLIEEARRSQQLQNSSPAPEPGPAQTGPSYVPPEVDANERMAAVTDKTLAPKPPAPPQPVYTPTNNPEAIQPTMQPTTSLADRYTAAAVPLEETTRPRMAMQPGYTPPVAPAGPAIPMYDDKGRPTGKVEGGADDLAKAEAVYKSYEDYDPTNHNSRGKSMLIGAGRGYVRGGLFGAILGAITHGIDPAQDEKVQRELDLASSGRKLQGQYARQKISNEMLNDQTERDYKHAQAEKLGRVEPHYLPDTAIGPVSVTDGKASPIYGPGNVPIGPKVAPTRKDTKIQWNADGKAEMWETENGKPTKKIPDWSDPTLNKVRTKAGNLVPQTTDETARAIAAETSYRHGRDTAGDIKHDKERAEDKTQQQLNQETTRRQKIGELTGKITGARSRWMEVDAKVTQLKEQLASETDDTVKAQLTDQIAGFENIRGKAAQEAAAAAQELKSNHGDLYEAEVGKGGLAYFKPRPFDVKQWRVKYPKATKEQEAAAIQNALEENPNREIIP